MTGHLGSSAIRAGTPQNPLPAVPKELVDQFLAEGGTAADETRAVAGWVIDRMLILLHPVMPFITEELWHAQGARAHDLIVAAHALQSGRIVLSRDASARFGDLPGVLAEQP